MENITNTYNASQPQVSNTNPQPHTIPSPQVDSNEVLYFSINQVYK